MSSGTGDTIIAAVLAQFSPYDKQQILADCAALFGIPNATFWCPLTLLQMSQTCEYYNQRVMNFALNQGNFPGFISPSITKSKASHQSTQETNRPTKPYFPKAGTSPMLSTPMPWTLMGPIVLERALRRTPVTATPPRPRAQPKPPRPKLPATHMSQLSSLLYYVQYVVPKTNDRTKENEKEKKR